MSWLSLSFSLSLTFSLTEMAISISVCTRMSLSVFICTPLCVCSIPSAVRSSELVSRVHLQQKCCVLRCNFLLWSNLSALSQVPRWGELLFSSITPWCYSVLMRPSNRQVKSAQTWNELALLKCYSIIPRKSPLSSLDLGAFLPLRDFSLSAGHSELENI